MSGQVDFNAAAAAWDDNPVRVQRAWQVAEAILREVPVRADMCALDYGCGTGLVALALQPHVCEMVAADNAEGMLEIVQQKVQAGGLKNVRAVLLDLEQEELGESGFDLIVSSMAFHHLQEPGLVLRRLAEGLNCGGFAALADLDGGSEDFHDQDEGIKHHGFGAAERQEMFAQAGLSGVRTLEVFRMPKEKDGVTREFPVLLTVGKKPAL